MWRKLVVNILVLAVPISASAGPLKDSVEKVGREMAVAQQQRETRSRARFWTGIALIAGGGVMATLGGMEVGDDEDGPDDNEDLDDSDDGEDSDGWGNKALIGGGIASAALGGVLLITGRKSGPVLSVRPRSVIVRHVVRW